LTSGGDAILERTSVCCSKPASDIGRASANGDCGTNDIAVDKGADVGRETSTGELPGMGVAISLTTTA
jgi:hypothetical protein